MTIKTTIKDGAGTGNEVEVGEFGFTKGGNGAVVYTEPRQQPLIAIKPAVNPVYGFAMNQNAAFGGTPEKIHNGIDGVLWTGSVEGGPANRFDFNSSLQANTGSSSVNATNSSNGNSAVFTSSSPITVANYTAFTMFIYITSWDTVDNTRDIEITPRLAGVPVGNHIAIASRINRFNTNAWQKVTILNSEFVFTSATFDELQMKTVATAGSPPDYFVDDLQLEQSGNPLSYIVKPEDGKVFIIDSYGVLLVDNINTTLADNSMPSISYDKLLGVTLNSGISVIVTQKGNAVSGGIFNGVGDFLSFVGRPIVTQGYDGTNTFYHMNLETGPIYLDSRYRDSVQFIITDDLSPLVRFEVVAFGKEYIIGE